MAQCSSMLTLQLCLSIVIAKRLLTVHRLRIEKMSAFLLIIKNHIYRRSEQRYSNVQGFQLGNYSILYIIKLALTLMHIHVQTKFKQSIIASTVSFVVSEKNVFYFLLLYFYSTVLYTVYVLSFSYSQLLHGGGGFFFFSVLTFNVHQSLVVNERARTRQQINRGCASFLLAPQGYTRLSDLILHGKG